MRSKIIFLLALVMGVITTVLFIQYTEKFQAVETSEVQNTVQVVRAVRDIEKNVIITEEMLEEVEVPDENIHPDAVTELDDVIGKFAITRIVKGEILLSNRIQSIQEEENFVSRKIKEGYRAVSMGPDIVQSVTNLIEPGEYVDVIYTPGKEGENGKRISEQILSNVRVLAVGRRMNTQPSGQETYIEYSEVTLELTPKDAVKLVNGHETGELHLTLHPSISPTNESDK